MQRHITSELKNWYQSSRRKPLIIRGARQTGKSTTVRNFAEAEGLKLYEINLERFPDLDRVFASFNLKKIIAELEAILSQKIVADRSLLFLDEIQATPHAIAALRYFYEERPDLCVVTAGSLLEFALKNHEFSMPVGRVQYLNVEPMVFTEFLLALGQQYLCDLLTSWEPGTAIAEQANLQLIEWYRKYLLVGGMPEAVASFSEVEDLKETQAVHFEIINTFVDDFSKYDTRIEASLLRRVFEAIPGYIGRKVKYSALASELKASQIRACLELFSRARLVSLVFHSSCDGVPIESSRNFDIYKLLYLDTGLLVTSLGLDVSAISSFDNSDLVNIGSLSEQFVGQHLTYFVANALQSRNLSYWLREGKKGNAEVDFVLANKFEIIPVEVKAGVSGTLRSLVQFVVKHQSKNAIRFDLNLPSVQEVSTQLPSEKGMITVRYKLHSLPIYLVEFVGKLMRSF